MFLSERCARSQHRNITVALVTILVKHFSLKKLLVRSILTKKNNPHLGGAKQLSKHVKTEIQKVAKAIKFSLNRQGNISGILRIQNLQNRKIYFTEVVTKCTRGRCHFWVAIDLKLFLSNAILLSVLNETPRQRIKQNRFYKSGNAVPCKTKLRWVNPLVIVF